MLREELNHEQAVSSRQHPQVLNEPVEKEKIIANLRAAMQASSAGNQQPWEFYVVTDKKKLEALSKVHSCLHVTGDQDFFITLIPHLLWALQAQLPLLHNGMLPFNGDETCIAGGIQPRGCISCGALEATCLFVAGAEACLPLIRRFCGEEEWMVRVEAAATSARAGFSLPPRKR